MPHTSELPGSVLRRMRLQRDLTLKQAAAHLKISSAALSRLERDQREVDRADLVDAIAAYELTPWEAYYLYSVAGFLPSQTPQIDDERFQEYALDVLQNLAEPAMLMDRVGYFLAWNDTLQVTMGLGAGTPGHPLDGVFSDVVRVMYGEEWRAYAARSMGLFYAKSLPIANDEAFRELMAELADRHGADFLSIWQEAQHTNVDRRHFSESGMGGVEHYMTPCGPVAYLVTASMMRPPSMMEIYVFVPYGEESTCRHREIEKMAARGVVHFSPRMVQSSMVIQSEG